MHYINTNCDRTPTLIYYADTVDGSTVAKLFSRIYFCMNGMANSIAPLAVIITPANTKPGAYDPNLSNNVPAAGGPTSDAIPWNSSNKPNALVRCSNPRRSTKITDVSPT